MRKPAREFFLHMRNILCARLAGCQRESRAEMSVAMNSFSTGVPMNKLLMDQ